MYRVGPPQKPQLDPNHFKDDFAWNSEEPSLADRLSLLKWLHILGGAELLGHVPDGVRAYKHYLGGTGEDLQVDLTKGYNEDSSIRATGDSEIARAAAGAEELIRGGQTSFSMTGEASWSNDYTATSNWDKTLGDFQVWSSSNVRVEGNQVTMDVVVHS